MLLFLIIFAWTPPHFWSLALYRREEYRRADVPMLPVTHGERYTRLNILTYTIILAAICLAPFAAGMSGWVYLSCVLSLNAVFVVYGSGSEPVTAINSRGACFAIRSHTSSSCLPRCSSITQARGVGDQMVMVSQRTVGSIQPWRADPDG